MDRCINMATWILSHGHQGSQKATLRILDRYAYKIDKGTGSSQNTLRPPQGVPRPLPEPLKASRAPLVSPSDVLGILQWILQHFGHHSRALRFVHSTEPVASCKTLSTHGATSMPLGRPRDLRSQVTLGPKAHLILSVILNDTANKANKLVTATCTN